MESLVKSRVIGCMEDAVTAVKLSFSNSLNLPEGWEYLGSGLYRWVIASPKGIAYKVSSSRPIQHREYTNCSRYADKEWAVPCYLWDLPTGEAVIAMPRIEGEKPPADYSETIKFRLLTERQQALLRDASLYLSDLHAENVILVDGGLKVIDAGM